MQVMTERKYFKTGVEARAELIKDGYRYDDLTNSSFNYVSRNGLIDAGIRSDIIGVWIEYRS
jgi:hypothetical protein